MQRRPHPPSLSSNRPATPPSTPGGLGALSTTFSGIGGGGGGGAAKKPVKRGGKSGSGVLLPMWAMLFLALGIMGVSSWYWFPSQVTEAEKEAVAGAQELGRKALQAEKEALAGAQELGRKALEAEHRVEDWFHKTTDNNKQAQAQAAQGGAGSIPTRTKLTSAEATARMLAQSSTWVDGEKKLKAKLKVLAERQQDGKDLGVPVLTRYLGEDIPAWVGEGVDEAEWRKQVEAKYAEMRVEEEQWKIRMQAIIDQRERDMGITTA